LATLSILNERFSDEAFMTFGCTAEDGNASGTYLLQNVTSINDVYQAIYDLVGTVSLANNSLLNVQRQIPAAHPYLPSFFVQNIISFKGRGGQFTQNINPINLNYPDIQYWNLWNNYEIVCNFKPRDFPIYNDSQLGSVQTSTWYNDLGTEVTYSYLPEWERFCNIEKSPRDDNVTMQFGQMTFNAMGITQDSRQFTAQPKLPLKNSNLTINWWNVPYTYVTSANSYLDRFLYRVNDQEFNTYNFGNYPAGSLLFTNYTTKIITPATNNANYVGSFNNLEYWPRYCNIQLQFLLTKRTLGAQPQTLPPQYTASGHNSLPYFGSSKDPLNNTFLYCNSYPTSAAYAAPLWKSYPTFLLWQNPDCTTNAGV